MHTQGNVQGHIFSLTNTHTHQMHTHAHFTGTHLLTHTPHAHTCKFTGTHFLSLTQTHTYAKRAHGQCVFQKEFDTRMTQISFLIKWYIDILIKRDLPGVLQYISSGSFFILNFP